MKIVRSSQAILVAIFCALAVVAAYLLPQAGTFEKQNTAGGVTVDEGSVNETRRTGPRRS